MLAQSSRISNSVVQSTPDNMLEWALWYARNGFHIFPCHTPLVDHPKGYKCTCEDYRHSARCKSQHPHIYLESGQHCQQPGKHPRGMESWSKEATTDEDQIRKWWSKYPTANIGHIPGRKGWVMLDGDTYKDGFADVAGLTEQERETVTAISGRGGEHLYYRKWEGATYSNAAGELAEYKRDVRGDTGYAILPPSKGTQQEYAWEHGYGPMDIEPQLLPERVHKLLVDATHKSASKRCSFDDKTVVPTTSKPDLNGWKLSDRIVELIMHPKERGERSEADQAVCVALLGAGMDDELVLSVFEHYPIGTEGKFRERGLGYLATTITSAKDYIDAHPFQVWSVEVDPVFLAQLEAVRLFGRTSAFTRLVGDLNDNRAEDTERVKVTGNDIKVFDALCDLWGECGSFTSNIVGKRKVAKLAGVSANTAQRALDRLALSVIEIDDQGQYGCRYRLNISRLTDLDHHTHMAGVFNAVNAVDPVEGVGESGEAVETVCNEYSPRKAADPFQSGVSRLVKRLIRAAREGDYWSKSGDESWDKARRGLGETSLRVLDALARCGDMTAQELSEETGKSIHAVRDSLARLHAFMPEYISAVRTGRYGVKVWTLAPEAFEEIESREAELKTYRMQACREDRRLEAAQLWTVRTLETAKSTVEKLVATEKLRMLTEERAQVLMQVYPEFSYDDAYRFASDLSVKEWKHKRAEIERLANERQEREALREKVADMVADLDDQLDGLSRLEANSKLTMAGFSAGDIYLINQVRYGYLNTQEDYDDGQGQSVGEWDTGQDSAADNTVGSGPVTLSGESDEGSGDLCESPVPVDSYRQAALGSSGYAKFYRYNDCSQAGCG